jgi:hypothetical protein
MPRLSPDYAELVAGHKLKEPGQISAITKRLINGEWHQSEERFGD